MFPETLEQWVIIIVAAVSGLFMGQWIRRQRHKKDPYALPLPSQTRPRRSKKERRKLKGKS